MNILRPILSALLAPLLVASGAAQAVEFTQFQADKSTLKFVSKQMGVAVDGRFKKFSATLAFDPARPAAATARLDLDLASVDAGSAEADGEVVGKPWFNVKLFPTATFVATAIRPLGGDKFELVGKLTIKDKTQDVSAPFSFREEGGHAIFAGAVVLKRRALGVGDGIWCDVRAGANELQKNFKIVAAPTAAGK